MYHHLANELHLIGEEFQCYFCLTKEQFEEVLVLVGPHLHKWNLTRESIGPKERLAICLR